MTEREAIVLLNALPGVGSVKVRKLIEHFGSASRALNAREKEFLASGIVTRSGLQKIYDFDRDNFLQNEYNLIQRDHVSIVTIFDDNYPQALKSLHDPPVVLYVRGSLPPENAVSVAVVGSRDASVYGLIIAEKFSCQLSELGFCIVSGLAKGIDAAAHRGALKTGGQTVAVIGCGLQHIYPEENKDLYAQIGQKGAVISEFPMMTPPISFNFPARNRIISGLSLAVLVIEASLKSGALITSRFALEQGRDVFAVPGKIDHPNSQGVNRLIKEGAKLVTCFEDILEELEPELRRKIGQQNKADQDKSELGTELKQHLEASELEIVGVLDQEPLYIDDLFGKVNQSHGDIAKTLLKLELKRVIKQLPGKYFLRA